MKRISFIAATVVCGAFLVNSCSALMPTQTSTDSSTSSSTTTATTSNSSSSTGTLQSILGSLLGGVTTTTSSLIGTWTYSEPAVQFESENLLAKAGGSVAGAKVVEKIEPYFEKIGIKEGNMKLALNKDESCVITIGSKTYSGTYVFDDSANTLKITCTALSSPTAYVTVSGSAMALTFDSSKLLKLIQKAGSVSSSNSTLSTISTLASSYDGMKVGFTFKK